MATIDLQPIIQPLVELAAVAAVTVVSASITWAANSLRRKFDIEIDQHKIDQVEAAMKKSVHAAGMLAEDLAHQKGWDNVEVKSQIVRDAAKYFFAKFPDAVKASPFDPETEEGYQNLQVAMRRLLPTALTAVVDSPVTTYGPENRPDQETPHASIQLTSQ